MKKVRYIVEGYKNGNLYYKTYATDDLQLLQIIIFFLRQKVYDEIKIRRVG